MILDIATGWVEGVRQVYSPNQDARPAGCRVEVVVVHAISLPPGQFGGDWVEQFFCNRLRAESHPYFMQICNLRVSAHFLIRRDGEIIQFVPAHRRAWHAGKSRYQQRLCVNDFSIGIELEGCDEERFTDRQYVELASLSRMLMDCYPQITPKSIVGHSDVAPGRKTDPGPYFDWSYYFTLLTRRALKQK